MFKKHHDEEEAPKRRKRGMPLPFVIARMFLSLIMLSIFGLAILTAYRHFSGTDPLTISPKNALVSVATSNASADFVNALFTLDVKKATQSIQRMLADSLKQPNLAPNDSQSAISSIVPQSTFIPTAPLLMKFALIADSHTDTEDLSKALKQAKDNQVKFVIGLGDYSQVGTAQELQATKSIITASGLPFYGTAGDHDLWDCRNRKQSPDCNFTTIFGSTYQSFSDSNIRFIILYDSDNYDGIDALQMKWLDDELQRVAINQPKHLFVFTHEPLYHPSSDHFMGKDNPRLQTQAKDVLSKLKQAKVSEIFYGDTHFYGRYVDPTTSIKMTTVGAVTRERNAQASRFAIVDVIKMEVTMSKI